MKLYPWLLWRNFWSWCAFKVTRSCFIRQRTPVQGQIWECPSECNPKLCCKLSKRGTIFLFSFSLFCLLYLSSVPPSYLILSTRLTFFFLSFLSSPLPFLFYLSFLLSVFYYFFITFSLLFFTHTIVIFICLFIIKLASILSHNFCFLCVVFSIQLCMILSSILSFSNIVLFLLYEPLDFLLFFLPVHAHRWPHMSQGPRSVHQLCPWRRRSMFPRNCSLHRRMSLLSNQALGYQTCNA